MTQIDNVISGDFGKLLESKPIRKSRIISMPDPLRPLCLVYQEIWDVHIVPIFRLDGHEERVVWQEVFCDTD